MGISETPTGSGAPQGLLCDVRILEGRDQRPNENYSLKRCVACVIAPPARIAAAMTAASASISSVAPSLRADCVCSSIQYGHWVVSATATAINCLFTASIAPGANAALSKDQNAFIASEAFSSRCLSFARFEMLYTALSPREIGIKKSRRADPTKKTRDTRCLVSPYAQWPVDYRSNCDEPLCLKVTP